MTKIIYTAYFVGQPSELLKKIPVLLHGSELKVYGHHLTIEFRPKNDAGLTIGRKLILRARSQVVTDRIQAILIESNVNELLSSNVYPHITIATVCGASPSESNDAIARAVSNNTILQLKSEIEIEVTEGYFDGQQIHARVNN